MALPTHGTLGQFVVYNGYNYQWTGAAWINRGQVSVTANSVAANTVTSGNTTVNTAITANGVATGNSTVNTSITANGVSTGNTAVTGTGIATGNSTVNTAVSANGIATGNSTVNTAISANGVATGNSTVNTAISANSVTTGNTAVTGTGIATGNSTVNTAVSANGIATGNSTVNTSISANGVTTGNTAVTGTGIATGNSTVNTAVSANGIATGNSTVNTAITANGVTTGNTAVTGTGINTGNSTVNTAVSANGIATGNSTVNTSITANGVTTGNTAVTGTGISIGNTTVNTSLTGTGIVVGNTTVNTTVNSSIVSVGNVAIKANSIVIAANASIDFDTTTYKPTYQKGRMYWDNEEQTIIVYGDGISSFEIALGQREWVRTRNSTASTIPLGTPVYITGVHISGNPVHGHHPTIAPGDASDYTKSQIIGITGEDIAPSAHGYTVVRGYVEGLDTSALVAGQRAHLGFSTPGTIVQNAPEYPNYPTDLGMCLTADATVGTFYVDLAMHTAERFRTTQDMYVGGDLSVSGNLNITGSVTTTNATNLSVGDNILYVGTGDTISSGATTFTGSGLNDMLFHGVFEGTSSIHYYVKIDSTGTTDTFAWSKDNFATTEASGVAITGNYQTLDNGIKVQFNALTGHTLNNKWDGTAAPVNVDLGWVGNYNDGTYHHTGIFRDASDGIYKFFQGYTPEPDAAVNIDTSHGSFQLASVQANTFTGNLIGTANNANNLGGVAAASYMTNTGVYTISGVHTHSANVRLNASLIDSTGAQGTAGQILTSNGAGNVYWSTVTSGGGAGVNVDSQYTWTNTQTFSNTITFSSVIIGTANNANNLGGISLTTLQGQITGNAATAYTNAVSYTDGKILTANGAITGNAATAYTNAVSYTDGKILTANGAITGNAATAYSNAVSYVDGKILTANSAITGNAATAYANAIAYSGNAVAAYTNAVSYTDAKILTANGAITGNAATAYTNAVSYTDARILTANGAITGNAATAYTNAVSYTDDKILTANSAITGNAATSYSNSVSYVDGKILTANGAITGNAATAYTNAVAAIAISTANNANYLGGTIAASYQLNSTLNANIASYLPTYNGVINATSHTVGTSFVANTLQVTIDNIPLSANGSTGTATYVLTSNGSVGSPYWAAAASGGGGGWTGGTMANTVAFSNTEASTNAISGAVVITGGLGVNGNIYTAGRVGFSNATNISVAYTYYNATTGSLDTVFG
jgi:hypothetical protein